MGSHHHRTDFSRIDVCGSSVTMEKESQEWREMTFSQREGEVPLPEPLQLEHLSINFRNYLWSILDASLESGIYDSYYTQEFSSDELGEFWQNFSWSVQIDILKKPHDEHDKNSEYLHQYLRKLILFGKYDEVITITEHLLRHPDIDDALSTAIGKLFFDSSAYLIDKSSKPICIVPTTSKEMKKCVQAALNNINQSDLPGAREHLRKAAEEFKSQEYAASVRESIHAVESAARTIAPEPSKGLGPALNALKKNGLIKHPALIEGFKKFYGYTSDEEGIRHSWVGANSSTVEFDEAMFMYAACVAFVDYLILKQNKLKKDDNS